ncbi:MAG: DinB family protein [Gemmatimonadetes bacterium]|nr:DinB family protein [Gemmatimonadota bacterium]
MTSLSHPAGQAKSTGSEYIEMLLKTLGERDPVAVLESTPDKLERSIAGLDEATLHRPEKTGKWSILEVIQHLADSELVFGYRIRMVVSHPAPAIQGFDQDLWAKELNYAERHLADSLAEFRCLRDSNLRLLQSLGPEKLQRYGHHSERGKESVEQMMKLYAAHDLVHLKQIGRIEATVTK